MDHQAPRGGSSSGSPGTPGAAAHVASHRAVPRGAEKARHGRLAVVVRREEQQRRAEAGEVEHGGRVLVLAEAAGSVVTVGVAEEARVAPDGRRRRGAPLTGDDEPGRSREAGGAVRGGTEPCRTW